MEEITYRVTTTYGNREVNFQNKPDAENFYNGLCTTQRVSLLKVITTYGPELQYNELKVLVSQL